MRKFTRIMTIVSLCVLVSLAAIACNDSPIPPNSGTAAAPVIMNKPSDNKLTITEDSNTYRFEIGEYDGTVTWYSSVKDVAEISADGLLTMKSAGVTEVIVKDTATDKSDSVVLTITDERLDHRLAIEGLPETVRVGCDDIQLTATDTAVEGAVLSATWKTNNPSVATVNETTGLMHIVGKGTATITATKTDDASMKNTLVVNALGAAVTNVTFENAPKYGMLMQNSYDFSAKAEPADADDYQIEWTVDDEDVATVDENGTVTALTAGDCKIKAIVTGEGMGTVVHEEQYTVYALNAESEDFRFAQMSGNKITGIGMTIGFQEVTGEVIDLDNAVQNKALKITTADATADKTYNHVELNFGERAAGSYKITLKFDVRSGEHSGSILVPGDSDAYTTLDAMSCGGDVYSFVFNHAATGDLRVRFVNKAYKESEVIIDDISIEQYTLTPLTNALGSTVVTFDEDIVPTGKGIYALHNSELTVSDGQLQVSNGSVALYVGDVQKGRYNLKLDATFENDYPAIAKIAYDVGADQSAGAVWEIGYNLGNTETGLAALAKKSGENTYTLTFSFENAYSAVAIILCDNTNALNGTMTLDNVSFVKETYAEKVTIADFENGVFHTNTWGVKPPLNYSVGASIDVNALANAGSVIDKPDTDTNTDVGNKYYTKCSASAYARLNAGWFETGTYTFTFMVKADVAVNNAKVEYKIICDGAGSAAETSYTDKTAVQAAINITTEWTEVSVSVTITDDPQAHFVKIGLRLANLTATYYLDNFTVQKTA